MQEPGTPPGNAPERRVCAQPGDGIRVGDRVQIPHSERFLEKRPCGLMARQADTARGPHVSDRCAGVACGERGSGVLRMVSIQPRRTPRMTWSVSACWKAVAAL